MTVATYRGIKYDTSIPKQKYKEWYENTHSESSPDNTYRGLRYSPSHNGDWEK